MIATPIPSGSSDVSMAGVGRSSTMLPPPSSGTHTGKPVLPSTRRSSGVLTPCASHVAEGVDDRNSDPLGIKRCEHGWRGKIEYDAAPALERHAYRKTGAAVDKTVVRCPYPMCVARSRGGR